MLKTSYAPPNHDYDPRPAYQREASHPSRGYAVIMDSPFDIVPVKTRVMRLVARIVILMGCAVIVFAVGTTMIELPS